MNWLSASERRDWIERALLARGLRLRRAIVQELNNRVVTPNLGAMAWWLRATRGDLAPRDPDQGEEDAAARGCAEEAIRLSLGATVYAIPFSSPESSAAALVSEALGVMLDLAPDRAEEALRQQAVLRRLVREACESPRDRPPVTPRPSGTFEESRAIPAPPRAQGGEVVQVLENGTCGTASPPKGRKK